ncbi:GIY-YIG nuclease family protein [Rhizobium leguminosarum]|uniref:GIY-YIG nuclease family protein n=1 Tax=Rhizobium leguminosarum TaxID=384 RepID=UPI001C946678|nr:GIY-YIG nuclease family protein [Rhizobium leguminosarum]MBY5819893.1 GIY-YIG nuclease family protein [Rhizobium leguminosarum]
MDAIRTTKASQIRALAADGMATADIARQLGIRYQHAYHVLKRSGIDPKVVTASPPLPIPKRQPEKPPLPVSVLTEGGFAYAGLWSLSPTEDLITDFALPKEVGVYAFVKAGFAIYVGVATMGIAKRLYFYGRPGITQRTSQRLNAAIKEELRRAAMIEIYVAFPSDLEWNGLPVHGSAGLELGLIKRYALPWNMRSAG